MRLNARRGLFRLWIICSVVWMAVVSYIGYSEFKTAHDRWKPPIDEILLPIDCAQARGKEGADFDKRDGHCWYGLGKFRTSFPEYRALSDYDLSKNLYEKTGVKWDDNSGWKKLLQTAGYGMGIPLLILILGWALIWAIAGFREQRPGAGTHKGIALRKKDRSGQLVG